MKGNLGNYILISICFLLSSTGAIADDTGQTRRKHNFSIGIETMHFDYEEEVDGNTFMEEDGLLYGLIAGYTYHDDNNMMFNTTIEYLKGDNLDYDG